MITVQNMLQDTPFVSYSYSYPHKSAYRPFEPALPLSRIWDNEKQDALSLYVHLPFCEYRCGFCNLFTLSNPQKDLAGKYLQQLGVHARQIRETFKDAKISQLAIGGGTPTYLDCRELEQLFSILSVEMQYHPGEIPACIEVSPATLTKEKAILLRENGIDRLSIGIQSFNEDESLSMGRPQKRSEIDRALDVIHTVDFSILNLDLIYGAEGQTVPSWLDSIQTALEHHPQEMYLYPLYVRPLTGLGRRLQEWDDHRLALYRAGRQYLIDHGYEQVSLRMFRADRSSNQEETRYCCQTDGMIGLGCGARSYATEYHYSTEYAVGRSSVSSVISNYLNRDPQSFGFADYGFHLDRDEQQRRFVILSLLQTDGLSREKYLQRFDEDVLAHYPELNQLNSLEMAEVTHETITLTSLGIERSDVIGPWLYSGKVQQRMEAFQCH